MIQYMIKVPMLNMKLAVSFICMCDCMSMFKVAGLSRKVLKKSSFLDKSCANVIVMEVDVKLIVLRVFGCSGCIWDAWNILCGV